MHGVPYYWPLWEYRVLLFFHNWSNTTMYRIEGEDTSIWCIVGSPTLQEINVYRLKVAGRMIFLFHRCDMLVPRRAPDLWLERSLTLLPDARELAWPFCGPDSRSSLMGQEVLRRSLEELSKVAVFGWRDDGMTPPRKLTVRTWKMMGLEEYLPSKMFPFSVGHVNFSGV